LLAEQVAAHNAACAAPDRLTLTERRREGKNAAWALSDQAGSLTTEFEYLVWDDLVRQHWISNPLAMLASAVEAYHYILRHRDRPLERMVPGGSRFTLYAPGLALILLPLLFALIGWGVLRLWLGDGAALALALAAGTGLSLFILKRMHSLWILRFVIFNDLLARRRVAPALWDRLDAFAARLDAALGEDWDEVLFVSHSNGAVLSVPVMARLLALRGGALPPHYAMATLGGCIQFLAARRDAVWFAQDLDSLGQGGFLWLDIGSLTDGACVPLVDPCLGRPVPRPAGLVQLSPRWFKYCDPAKYQARRRDKYLTHFDYLRRLDRPSALDYLGLTAAARPLAASIAAFEAEQNG
jgi:hypothetical protein